MSISFAGGLAHRAGWAGFSVLLGRWVGPQLTTYVVGATARQYIWPLTGVGLAAAAVNALQHRLLTHHPNTRQHLGTCLNGVMFVSSGMAAVCAVFWFVSWNNPGPIMALIDSAQQVFANADIGMFQRFTALLPPPGPDTLPH